MSPDILITLFSLSTVGLRLRVDFVLGYPEVAPAVAVEPEKGLNAKQLEMLRGILAEGIRVRL